MRRPHERASRAQSYEAWSALLTCVAIACGSGAAERRTTSSDPPPEPHVEAPSIVEAPHEEPTAGEMPEEPPAAAAAAGEPGPVTPPPPATSGPLIAPGDWPESAQLLETVVLDGSLHVVFELRGRDGRPTYVLHPLDGIGLGPERLRWQAPAVQVRFVRVLASIEGTGPWILVRPGGNESAASRVVAIRIADGVERELVPALPDTRTVTAVTDVAVLGDPPVVALGIEGNHRVRRPAREIRREMDPGDELVLPPDPYRDTARVAAWITGARPGEIELGRERPPWTSEASTRAVALAANGPTFVGVHRTLAGYEEKLHLTWFDARGRRRARADDVAAGKGSARALDVHLDADGRAWLFGVVRSSAGERLLLQQWDASHARVADEIVRLHPRETFYVGAIAACGGARRALVTLTGNEQHRVASIVLEDGGQTRVEPDLVHLPWVGSKLATGCASDGSTIVVIGGPEGRGPWMVATRAR